MEKLLEYIYSDVKYNRKELYHTLRKLSDIFIENGVVNYFDREKNLYAYLYYFYPQSLVKNHLILRELSVSRFFNKFKHRKMSVVDLGAGLAPSASALIIYLSQLKIFPERLNITVVEKSKLAIEHAEKLIHKTLKFYKTGKVNVRFSRSGFEKFLEKVDGPFDIIFMSNAFKEFYNQTGNFDFLERLKEQLSPDGAIVILEPGARRESRDLIALRNYAVEKVGLHVYAPCMGDEICPLTGKPEEWCHVSREWDPPELTRDLGNMLKRDFKRVKFSYLVLMKRDLNYSRYILKQKPEGGEVWHAFTELRKEKGKIKFRACRGPKWVEIERLDRHRNENNYQFDHVRSHSLVWFSSLNELQEWVLRLDEDTVVKILYSME